MRQICYSDILNVVQLVNTSNAELRSRQCGSYTGLETWHAYTYTLSLLLSGMILHGAELFLRCLKLYSYSLSISQNLNVNYCVHKSSPPVLIPRRISQSTRPYPTSLRYILILSIHLCLCLCMVCFLLDFPSISYMHSSSSPVVLHAVPISTSMTSSY